MKLVVIIFGLALSGCATWHLGRVAPRSPENELLVSMKSTEGTFSVRPEGELLAAIKLTEGAFTGRPKGTTGFFFYVASPSGAIKPLLTGYEYRNGEICGLIGGGSDSAMIIEAIRGVGLEPFDFDAEVASTTARLDSEAQAQGERYIGPMVMDGAEYEIFIHTPSGVFVLKEWNPGYTIDALAPHNAKIAKLKAVIDILAVYYGRTKFGV